MVSHTSVNPLYIRMTNGTFTFSLLLLKLGSFKPSKQRSRVQSEHKNKNDERKKQSIIRRGCGRRGLRRRGGRRCARLRSRGPAHNATKKYRQIGHDDMT
jgi:hypothetical protein